MGDRQDDSRHDFLAFYRRIFKALSRVRPKPHQTVTDIIINWLIPYQILVIVLPPVIPIMDKEPGRCSDGWHRNVEGRAPPRRRKSSTRSFLRSFPMPLLQAAALLRPQDAQAPGRDKSSPPFSWSDSWCAIRENTDSDSFRPRPRHMRTWSNVRPSPYSAEPTAFARVTGRWPTNAFN